MLSFEEMRAVLTGLCDELPQGIFDKLNGGILLLPETKQKSAGDKNPLYVMGEYRNDAYGLGRYIVIFYGSFERVYGELQVEDQVRELRKILHHELTHHIENLAGDRSLERQDERDLEDYMK